MCKTCWEEAGSHRVNWWEDKFRAAIQCCRDLYAVHGAGGHLHIVLDDSNFEDSHLDWCREQFADLTGYDRALHEAAYWTWRDLTEDERHGLMGYIDGCYGNYLEVWG